MHSFTDINTVNNSPLTFSTAWQASLTWSSQQNTNKRKLIGLFPSYHSLKHQTPLLLCPLQLPYSFFLQSNHFSLLAACQFRFVVALHCDQTCCFGLAQVLHHQPLIETESVMNNDIEAPKALEV